MSYKYKRGALTRTQKDEVRALLRNTSMTQRDIALRYGTTQANVSKIKLAG